MKVATIAFSLILATALAAPAQACNVPVFRYALERWRAAQYEILLFHRGPLGEAERAIVDSVHGRIDDGKGNFIFETVDLDKQKDEGLRQLIEAEANAELPWLIVRYPTETRIPQNVWSGKFTAEAIAALLDSPVRSELGKRILSGETAIWLFLKSGDRDKDEAAKALIEKQLKQLAETLELPELTDSPDDAIAGEGPPLKVAFSLLSVARDDPAEQMLIRMLTGSEPDLVERAGEPMVFPVFGRGRALFTLVGAGITDENLFDAASFLVGPCSCQVKELNPGFDLLLATDWSIVPSELTEEGGQQAPGGGQFVEIATGNPTPPQRLTAAAGTRSPTAQEAFSKFWIMVAIGAVAFLAVVSGAMALSPRSTRSANEG